MDLAFFGRGFVLGFAIAAPVGPIGLLCIQRTLSQGRTIGVASGLGAATADAVYGSIAAFGLTLIAAVLVQQQFWLGVAGGLFLCYLGVRTLLAAPAADAARAEAKGIASAFGSTFLLTLTNPLTILAFVAIFAGAGLTATGGDMLAAAIIVAGVFCGSASWWLLLSSVVGLLRTRINGAAMVWVNRVAGAVIVAFGVLSLARALMRASTMPSWPTGHDLAVRVATADIASTGGRK